MGEVHATRIAFRLLAMVICLVLLLSVCARCAQAADVFERTGFNGITTKQIAPVETVEKEQQVKTEVRCVSGMQIVIVTKGNSVAVTPVFENNGALRGSVTVKECR